MTVRKSSGKKEDDALRRLLESAHLAAGLGNELSELEGNLIVASAAFSRWTVRCMAAAGQPDLAHLEVMVLQSVDHQDQARKLADICLVLNVEDTHLVGYAIKKLVKRGLVDSVRPGREKRYSTSAAGREACRRFDEVRGQCLLQAFAQTGLKTEEIRRLAGVLGAFSGLYEQAARAATVL